MQLIRSVPWRCQSLLKRSNLCVNKLYQHRHILIKRLPEQQVASIPVFSGCWASNETCEKRFYSELKTSKEDSYKPVYRFSHIVLFRLICRAKLYQTGLVICSIPLVNYLHQIGTMSTTMAFSFSGVVSLAAIMLYIMGEFFRKVVGIISVNESMTAVQISHLTFFGKRRDILVNVKDIVPLSDSPQNLSDVFVTIKFYNSDNSFYLFHNHGVLEAEKLKQVLE